MAPSIGARIQAFDWLRGLAVLFMIQCHAMVLLLPSLKEEPLFRTLVRVDGLVAPSFTFAAGFSLALVQVRGAAGGARWIRMLKTLRRLGEVLAVASLVNLMWFPIWREPKWLIRLDILHCIGLSLLLALPVMVVLAPRPKVLRWVALLLAAVTFGISPLLEHGAAPFDWLLNTSTGSVFPLLPWAGYVYLGASAGATAAMGDFWALVRWIVCLGLLGAAIWLATPWFASIYPPHNFWVANPANCAQRWTVIMGVVLALMAFEHKGIRLVKSAPVRFVAVFGSSSMAAYFFHEALLYFRLPPIYFSFSAWWGQSCGWGKYAALTAVLIGCTFVLVLLTDRIYRWVDARLPSLPRA
jgi:uncharacterized membrane protein